MPVMVGAPVPLIEKLSFGSELDTVFHALTAISDGTLVALMSPEMGGVNSVVPILLGARLGIPVVDADSMGRAYPEIDLTTLTLYGIDASPFALADEHGNSLIISGVTNRWVERIARAAVVEFGAICAGMGFPMTGAQLREAAILGTLSYAEEIGAAIREARGLHGDAIAEIAADHERLRAVRGQDHRCPAADDARLVGGRGRDGGHRGFTGSGMTVSFQNENLVAWRDGDVVAAVPDLITIIDSDAGTAITTERLRYGARVIVLGMPCDEKWRTPAGVALGGPGHFHYDFEWAPIEALNPASIQPVR